MPLYVKLFYHEEPFLKIHMNICRAYNEYRSKLSYKFLLHNLTSDHTFSLLHHNQGILM